MAQADLSDCLQHLCHYVLKLTDRWMNTYASFSRVWRLVLDCADKRQRPCSNIDQIQDLLAYIQCGAFDHSQGSEDKNLGSSPGLFG